VFFFGVLGIGALMTAPFVSVALTGAMFASTGAASLAFSGAFGYSLIKEYSYLMHSFSPERISPEIRVYETNACEGGALKYINNIPVLKISAIEPEKIGFVQGYLTGKNIHQIFNKFLRPFAPYFFSELNAYKNALNQVKKFKFPPHYEKELQGIVNGYNCWLKEESQKKQLFIASRLLTVDDLKIFHAFPDLLTQNSSLRNASCSTVACRKNGEMYVASNFDYFSGNVLGSHTLVTMYKNDSNLSVATIGFAGGLAIRGMNRKGLCAVINKAGSLFKANQIPQFVLQRNLLEKCKSIKEAKDFIANHSPSSSHILTLADEQDSCLIQWYALKNNPKIEKSLTNEQYLVATNHFEDNSGQIIQDSVRDPSSVSRARTLHDRMKNQLPTPFSQVHVTNQLVSSFEEVLQETLRSVEMNDTIQSVVMNTKRKEIYLNWDNCYAADLKFQKLTFNDLFN